MKWVSRRPIDNKIEIDSLYQEEAIEQEYYRPTEKINITETTKN